MTINDKILRRNSHLLPFCNSDPLPCSSSVWWDVPNLLVIFQLPKYSNNSDILTFWHRQSNALYFPWLEMKFQYFCWPFLVHDLPWLPAELECWASVVWQCAATSMMSKFQEGLQAQRQLVEQLRVEAGIHRMTVSESVAEIMKYMQQHADNDVLMKGFAKQSDNPFKEKGGCLILWWCPDEMQSVLDQCKADCKWNAVTDIFSNWFRILSCLYSVNYYHSNGDIVAICGITKDKNRFKLQIVLVVLNNGSNICKQKFSVHVIKNSS